MESAWPWLAVAGLGALHGLNPATGWALAAARGLRSRDAKHSLRALLPIGAGHVASIALVAAAVTLGLALDRAWVQFVAATLFAAAVTLHLRRDAPRWREPAGDAALALWSFLASTLHGAGLTLVPALIPLCLGGRAAHAITVSGALLPALIAVAVHVVAMLVVTAALAGGAGSCVTWLSSALARDRVRRRQPSPSLRGGAETTHGPALPPVLP